MKNIVCYFYLIASTIIFSQPANDQCTGAISLTYGTGTQAWNCATTNVGATATNEPAAPACWNGTGVVTTTWFRATVPAGQSSINFTTDNVSGVNGAGGAIEIFSGACASLTSIACSDYTTSGYEQSLSSGVSATGITPGTYYCRVRTVLDGTSYDGGFCIKATSVPSNDCYASPTALVLGSTINGSTYGAGINACGASDCVLGGSNSVIDCGAGAGSSIENNVYYLMPCATTNTYTLSLTSVACNGANGLQLWASLNNATCTTWDAQKQDGSTGDGCNNTGAVAASMSTTFSCNAGQTVRLVIDGFAGELCTFGIVYNTVVLPIQLLSFNAEKKEDEVSIVWITASERNNDYFIVQKSLDGVSYFDVGQINGAGNSSEKIIYNFSDSDIGNETFAYYRLKQVDYDGAVALHEPTYLELNNEIYVRATPNPMESNTFISFNAKKSSLATLSVEDYNGKVVLSKIIECSAGGNNHEIDLSEFKKGFYFVTVDLEEKILRTKILKTQD